MKDRIRRAAVLFKELGYEIVEEENSEETYVAAFEYPDGFQSSFFIDEDSRFVEIAYTFAFSPAMGDFLKSRLEEMLEVSYEYGCYISIQNFHEDISYSIFSKLYFSGLNYYSLKETLRDFRLAINEVKQLIEIHSGMGKGEHHGNP